MDFSSLDDAERRAIFRTLWEMARVDRKVGEPERLRLEELHQALFDAPMPKTAYPYPDEAPLADRVQRPGAREALFRAVFALLRADERTTSGERTLFGELCQRLGVDAEGERALWESCAREYFVRRSRVLIEQQLEELAEALISLSEDLGLGVEQDALAEDELRLAAAPFVLDEVRRRRLMPP